jgi:Cu/Ag efflux pump CusA
VHSSEIEVDLKLGRPKTEIIADIRARLAVLPLSVNVGQPISHRLDHMLSGVRAEIALKIFGDDLDTLRSTAEALRTRLAQIPGITDLQVEKQPGAVIEELSRLSNGRIVSRIIDGYRRFDVVMRLPDTMRGIDRLGDLLIETPSGWVPARQLADIRETDGPNQILRETAAAAWSSSPTPMARPIWPPSSTVSGRSWRRPVCRTAISPVLKAHFRRRRKPAAPLARSRSSRCH